MLKTQAKKPTFGPSVSPGALFAVAKKALNPKNGPPNYASALALLKRAVALGHPAAHEWIAAAYDYGLGTKPNRVVSLKYYKVAAESGSANAQYHLGVYYRDGIGTRRNLKEAIRWTSRAYKQGDAGATYLLGDCYLRGLGVPKNEKKGFSLQIAAATKGVLEAHI